MFDEFLPYAYRLESLVQHLWHDFSPSLVLILVFLLNVKYIHWKNRCPWVGERTLVRLVVGIITENLERSHNLQLIYLIWVCGSRWEDRYMTSISSSKILFTRFNSHNIVGFWNSFRLLILDIPRVKALINKMIGHE